MRDRAAKTAAVMATPAGAAAQAAQEEDHASPQFAREVRAEARKITWTSRSETWITSVMVAIMVVLAAIFFCGRRLGPAASASPSSSSWRPAG